MTGIVIKNEMKMCAFEMKEEISHVAVFAKKSSLGFFMSSLIAW